VELQPDGTKKKLGRFNGAATIRPRKVSSLSFQGASE